MKSTPPWLPKQKCYWREFACIVTTAGVLWISREGNYRRIFLSLKFWIPVFNWVVNIRWYDEETNTIVQFLMFLLFMFLMPFGNLKFFFYGGGGGVNFCSRDFWGFVGSHRDFSGFWFLPSFDHPRHLKSRVPPGIVVNTVGFCPES